MDELTALVDSATGHLGGDARGLTSAYRELRRRLRSRALVEFVTVSSDFYPELRAYYAEEAKEWPARLEG